jgi:large subunit ribosomal protein L10
MKGGESVPTPRKESVVATVGELLSQSTGVIVIQFTKLSVPQITELRAKLRQVGGQMMVCKNRLVKLAVAGTGAERLSEELTGPNALVFCTGDVSPVVKALADFEKDLGGVQLRASFFEGTVYGQKPTQALATLPSRPELLSQLVGALEVPISGLVFALQGILNEFVYTLEAVADQKAGQAA